MGISTTISPIAPAVAGLTTYKIEGERIKDGYGPVWLADCMSIFNVGGFCVGK